MKDAADRLTAELPDVEPPRRGRGRPRQHATAAARQAAYRARQRQREAQQPAAAPLRSAVLDLSEVRQWPARASLKICD